MIKKVLLFSLTLFMISCGSSLDDKEPEPSYKISLYRVFYDGNTNTGGTAPSDDLEYKSGETAIVLAKGNLVKELMVFDSWNTSLDGLGNRYLEGDNLKIASEDVYLYAQWKELSIGDSYEGGKIAYILQDGDLDYDLNVPKGIIVSLVDQSLASPWIVGGDTQTTLNGGTFSDIRTGSLNTNAMISQSGYIGGIASICWHYSVEQEGLVYDDWFVPSIDDLEKLYQNKLLIGGFLDDFYWSSSEFDNYHAYLQYFGNGVIFIADKKEEFMFRCVRYF